MLLLLLVVVAVVIVVVVVVVVVFYHSLIHSRFTQPLDIQKLSVDYILHKTTKERGTN
jgi:hypothetical protein